MSFFSNPFVFMLYMLLLKHFIEREDSGNKEGCCRVFTHCSPQWASG